MDPYGARALPNLARIDHLRQQQFQELKPACVAVSQHILTATPSPRDLSASLQRLAETLRTVSGKHENTLDPKVADYVFFPLSHVFQRHAALHDQAVELSLQCLEILLRCAWRVGIAADLAKQLLVLLTFVVGGSPAPGTSAPRRSEETQLAACRCFERLFEDVARSDGAVVKDPQTVPAIGHTVVTLLDALSGTDSLELQLSTIKAVDLLLLDAINDDDTRARFYPGVVSSLVKAVGLGKTTKRPFRVLQEIVKLMNRLVCRVLGDATVTNLPETAPASDLEFKRTKAWLKATATNTATALIHILKLRTHPRAEVRTAVFEACRNLLESCPTTLSAASGDLVESMLVLAADEDKALALLAASTIRVVATMRQDAKEAMRSSLYGWITSLPRVMIGNDEDAKTRLIGRLSLAFGLVNELGLGDDLLQEKMVENMHESLTASTLNRKIQAAPVRPLTAAYSGALELLPRDGTGHTPEFTLFPDVVMDQRSQAHTVQSMKELLGSLGSSSETALSLAQRHVQETSTSGLRATSGDNIANLWMAVNLLRGAAEQSAGIDDFLDYDIAEHSGSQQSVMEELLAVSLGLLDTGSDLQDDPRADMVQCLALESLSLVAQTQKRAFRTDLVDALYPIVHHLGASSPQVQNHAIVALNNIALACEYSSAKELLLDNVDYMVNAVSLRLNMFDLSPQAPVVLNMMVRLVGSSLVPYLDDLVDSIFDLLEGFHGYEKLTESLFQVLGTVVAETAAGQEVLQIENGEAKPSRRKRKVMADEELFDLLAESRKRTKQTTEDPEDPTAPQQVPREPWGKGKGKEPEQPSMPEDMDADESPPPPKEEEPPPPSKSYRIVKRIALLSQHFLSQPSASLRAHLLHLVATAAPTLASLEDEFLPVVADVWSVVYDRLFDAEPHVVAAACGAIAALAAAAGGFLTSRINDGWPGIRRVYARAWAAVERERRGRGGLGVYGPEWKVWDAVVRMLAVALRELDVADAHAEDLCEMCGPAVLGERADLRRALEEAVPDSVWLEMQRGGAGMASEGLGALPQLDGVAFVEPVF